MNRKIFGRFEITALLALIMVFAAAFAGSMTCLARDCAEVRCNTLRLHIIANSDSDRDQQLKLLVRDVLLEEYSSSLLGSSFEDAEKNVDALLGDIERTANDTLRQNGCKYTASAELIEMYFSEREYDGLTMPAGRYKALRIKLGNASGKNWWCVMFPPLCIPAAMNSDDLAKELEQNFGENGTELLRSSKTPKYKVRFALLELIEELLSGCEK